MLAIRSLRRVPALSARMTRLYSEGDVARSREFSQKEKAHENQYIKQHEAQQLQKLREEIAKKKQELEALEKEHATIEKSK